MEEEKDGLFERVSGKLVLLAKLAKPSIDA